MKNMSGLMLSEIMTYIMLTMIVAAVAFGFYVSSERDGVVEGGEEALPEIQAVVEQAEQSGGSIACNSSLVSADVLENEFLSLVIRPMPLDAHNLDKGYGVGVFVESKKKKTVTTRLWLQNVCRKRLQWTRMMRIPENQNLPCG